MSWAEERRARHNERRAAEPTAANIDLFEDEGLLDGRNEFRASVDAGHKVDPRAQKIFVLCIALAALYAVAILVPKGWFDPGMNNLLHASGHNFFDRFATGLSENLTNVLAAITGEEKEGAAYGQTMMRYIMTILAGMGLAVSGAVYQGVFRNALVSPSSLGVMTGGQFGMALWVVGLAWMGFDPVPARSIEFAEGDAFVDYLNTSLGLSLTSFAGCFLVVGIVLVTLRMAGSKKTSGIMMIITGQVVGAVIGVFGTLARYYYITVDPYGPVAELLQNLQVSSFYRAYSWVEVLFLLVPLAATFFVVLAQSQRMMVMSLDVAEQRAAGIETRRMQIAIVGLCTLLTAVIISFCGAIGFVGFMVPHLARRLVGPNFKYLLPASMAMGGLFVMGAFFLVDFTLGADYTQMTGMFVSIAGAAVFLGSALRGKGAAYGAFR